jgi:hypothetical protein
MATKMALKDFNGSPYRSYLIALRLQKTSTVHLQKLREHFDPSRAREVYYGHVPMYHHLPATLHPLYVETLSRAAEQIEGPFSIDVKYPYRSMPSQNKGLYHVAMGLTSIHSARLHKAISSKLAQPVYDEYKKHDIAVKKGASYKDHFEFTRLRLPFRSCVIIHNKLSDEESERSLAKLKETNPKGAESIIATGLSMRRYHRQKDFPGRDWIEAGSIWEDFPFRGVDEKAV